MVIEDVGTEEARRRGGKRCAVVYSMGEMSSLL